MKGKDIFWRGGNTEKVSFVFEKRFTIDSTKGHRPYFD